MTPEPTYQATLLLSSLLNFEPSEIPFPFIMPFVTWGSSSHASASLLPRASLQENQMAPESELHLLASLKKHQENWRNTKAIGLMMT